MLTEEVSQGGGGSNHEDKLGTGFDIDTIVKLVSERIRPTTSNWKYYERAEPTSVAVLPNQDIPPYNYSTVVKKSDFNDVFDIKKALNKIPKEHRSNAVKLLNEVEKRSTELNFDSKGTIYLHGESISGNFFEFLPLLYKKRIPKTKVGFSDFYNALNAMGLSNLFTLRKEYYKKTKTDKELHNDILPSQSWWLLK